MRANTETLNAATTSPKNKWKGSGAERTAWGPRFRRGDQRAVSRPPPKKIKFSKKIGNVDSLTTTESVVCLDTSH
jgi:hypothetical protein